MLKALEKWHPGYINWWNDLIPQNGFQESAGLSAHCRVSVDPKGWAKFDYVKMPEYRWGVLLAPQVEDRQDPVRRALQANRPGRKCPVNTARMLRRLIVIQGDTEAGIGRAAAVSSAKTAPSLYDMRNLFQVNVEEGRHLWAMVYLLFRSISGRMAGRRPTTCCAGRSGSDEAPRMLGAFNEETPDWLSFFMFTYFTDRDGKMQLESLAQSGFDPLSRTCRFMLTEEAHHMFVGETGVSRTVQATVDAMNKAGITDPFDTDKIRDLGVIDLPTIQKKLNLHYTLSLDLFGQEVSTNAANAFNAGIKGRYMEHRLEDDHRLAGDTYNILDLDGDRIVEREVPALTAINMRLRDDYIRDASGGLRRWNKLISKGNIDFELKLPHQSFNRKIGVFAHKNFDPDGNLVSGEAYDQGEKDWLPTHADGDFIQSLMKPCYEPGKFASWIAPPKVGIDNRPGDFEYVKLHTA